MYKHPLLIAALTGTLAGCATGAITLSPGDDAGVETLTLEVRRTMDRGPGWRRRDAGPGPVADAGSPTPTLDAGPFPGDSGPAPMPVTDSGSPPPAPADGGPRLADAGPPPPPPPADAGSPCVGAGCTCIRATDLWSDGFESGDYREWTGNGYGGPWGDGCQNNAITTVHPHTGRYAQRSDIVCASTSPDGVHRGYGGLQFSGSTVLPEYTNTGSGLDAPNGIVTTFWVWLDAPAGFGDGRWMSLFTINPTCDYTQRVVTVGLDNADGIVRAAHYWPEGTMTIEPGAPPLPRGQWARLTVYMNLHTGVLHIWQDGRSIEHVSGIVRASRLMCQWHWGLYASADNTNIVLFEDDKSVWRLDQPWTDMTREPWLGATQAVCAP